MLDTRSATAKRLLLRGFGGGLNVRDAPPELQDGESPDCLNVTLDERGGFAPRLGFSDANGGTPPAALISTSYYSELIEKTIWQAGASLYTQTTPSSNFSAAAHTFTTTARCQMVDFVGFVYAIHPVDGVVRSADGTTWSAVAAGPDGKALAVWGNKLWAVGDSAQKVRLYGSAAGDGTTWSLTNDIRAVNDAPLVGLEVSPTEGLIVAKEESLYRVYNASDAAYQVLSPSVGFASPQAKVAYHGALWFACAQGIYRTDGISTPVQVSDKLRPLWTPGFLALSQLDKWAMGRKNDKIYLSLPRNGSTANNLAYELDADTGSIVPHSCAVSTYVTYGDDDETLLGGSPSVNGQASKLYDAVGTDDGAAISSRWMSKWFNPDALTLKQWLKVGLNGRGNPNLYIRLVHDSYDPTDPGELFLPDMRGQTSGTVLTWDNAQNWDSGAIWADGVTSFESYDELHAIGVGRAISFEFSSSRTDTATTPAYLDLTYTGTVGPWAVYEIQTDYVPLGLA